MPEELWVELGLILVLTLVLADVMAWIDIALIHRRARKRSEQQRTIDRLKR